MTNNEKTNLKEQISGVIKSRISQNGHIERRELKGLFTNSLAVLDDLIEELKYGQIIRENPSGGTYLSGIKFKSFKTYAKFIDEVNYGEKKRFKTTIVLSVVVILLTIATLIFQSKRPGHNQQISSLTSNYYQQQPIRTQ